MDNFVLKIKKSSDGEYSVWWSDESTTYGTEIKNLERMYDITKQINTYGTVDLLLVALLVSGFGDRSWWDEASKVIYECQKSNRTWEYDRNTYKWKRIDQQ